MRVKKEMASWGNQPPNRLLQRQCLLIRWGSFRLLALSPAPWKRHVGTFDLHPHAGFFFAMVPLTQKSLDLCKWGAVNSRLRLSKHSTPIQSFTSNSPSPRRSSHGRRVSPHTNFNWTLAVKTLRFFGRAFKLFLTFSSLAPRISPAAHLGLLRTLFNSATGEHRELVEV